MKHKQSYIGDGGEPVVQKGGFRSECPKCGTVLTRRAMGSRRKCYRCGGDPVVGKYFMAVNRHALAVKTVAALRKSMVPPTHRDRRVAGAVEYEQKVAISSAEDGVDAWAAEIEKSELALRKTFKITLCVCGHLMSDVEDCHVELSRKAFRRFPLKCPVKECECIVPTRADSSVEG